MAYFTFDELKGIVPDGWVTAALDDDANGDAEQFDVVQAVAEKEVNGVVGMRYAVPLNPVPEVLSTIAVYIAAEIVYGRRNQIEHFPYVDKLAVMRRQLRDIGAGTLPLTPTKDREKASVSIISEGSRVYSKNLNN
jgi:hypothetical protein